MSAIFWTLRLLAASRGIKDSEILEFAGNVETTRPRRYVPPTPEEIEAREIEEQRRAFAPTLARMKRALAAKSNE